MEQLLNRSKKINLFVIHKIRFFLLAFFIIALNAEGKTTESTKSGNWNTESVWSNGLPSNGDLVIIRSGHTITISDGNLKFNGEIHVYGTLYVPGQLTMDANSRILFAEGSDLISDGSNSNKINIGNKTIKGNQIDAVTTPNQLTESTLDKGGCAIAGGCDGNPLPITLSKFEGTNNNSSILLSFSTLSEQNFDYFSVERSAYAKNYFEIGRVKGAGWSHERKDYEFIDENPLPGLNYYRLKSVDYDGYTEYFSPISVYNKNCQVQVITVIEDKNLIVNSSIEATVDLVNLAGLKVFTGQIMPGANEFSLPPSVDKGLYALTIQSGQNVVKRTRVYVK